MKSNQEILSQFGSYMVSKIYDSGLYDFQAILTDTTTWGTGKVYSEIFGKLTPKEKLLIATYIREMLSATIFSFLEIFEENEEYKIIYEKDGKQVDLNKISEMLKSEHHGEDGWIARFSTIPDCEPKE